MINKYFQILNKIKFEHRISLTYLIIGILWIYFSDSFFDSIFESKQILTILHIVKGISYFILTSIILFFFVRKHSNKLKKAFEKLDENQHLLLKKNKKYEAINKELRQTNDELLLANKKVEESEVKFKAIFENSNDAIGISKKSINVFFNQAYIDLFGYQDHNEIIGKPIFEQISPKEHSSILQYIQKRANGEDVPNHYETIGQRKNGSEFPIEFTIGSFILNSEKYTIAIIRDITMRKKAEQELINAKEKAEESDRLKTAFLQNMSHEIRTPINAICGFSGQLNKPDLSDEKRKRFVSIIQNSSQQFLSIVNDILTISSLETKQEKPYYSKVCINNVIAELLSIYKQQSINQNISLDAKKELTDIQSEIFTDKTKITQILTNLLANALKFTQAGFVEFGYNLKTDIEPAEMEFYVKDSGIGIKPELHEKIFERFRQADKSIQLNYGGTGLGLSISKEFTQLLGGKIWVQSEPTKGATFYFTIPYKPANEIDKTVSPIQQNENFRTIVVAEDEEYNFLLIEEYLSNMDLKLIHSKDGKETIDICKANTYIDLILMDIKMPIMTGHEAAKVIKEFRPDLPIIAQSGYTLEHELEKYRGIFDDYITKPIKENELKEKVMKYIGIQLNTT